MKKVLSYVVIFLLTITIFVNKVYAEDITIDKVISKFQENLNELGLEDLNIQNNDNKLIINYKCTNSTEEEPKDCQTIYNIDNNIISYEFTGNKELENDVYKGVQDSLLSSILIYSVGGLKGYTVDDFKNFNIEDEAEEKFTIEEDGIEAKMFYYQFGDESAHISGNAYEVFKIDINKFDLNDLIRKYGNVESEVNLEKTNEGIVINIKANLEDGKFVKIYKSTNNQDFELLAEVSILNNEISYLDELVEKDKTYYYKVDLGDNTITNSLQYDLDNTVDKTIENPQTGMFDNVLHVLLIIGISLLGLKVLNKNEKIKQL